MNKNINIYIYYSMRQFSRPYSQDIKRRKTLNAMSHRTMFGDVSQRKW